VGLGSAAIGELLPLPLLLAGSCGASDCAGEEGGALSLLLWLAPCGVSAEGRCRTAVRDGS